MLTKVTCVTCYAQVSSKSVKNKLDNILPHCDAVVLAPFTWTRALAKAGVRFTLKAE